MPDSNAQELALADPKFVETLRKLGEEHGVDKDAYGKPYDKKMTDDELFRWAFIDGVDEAARDEIIEDFKKRYYGIKEEFNVADLDKFATDDSYDDPFNVDFDCEDGECEKEQEQQDELGKKVPEIADFSGSVELGHEPETAVNVSRSSSSFGGRKESTVDINVQCEDDEESITDALKELICSLGLEDEFDVDSCCDGEKCPEEPVAEPAAEPEEQAAKPEEVKDLSDEDEVKVKMPAEVADGVNDGDMLVVKVDSKEEEEKEGDLKEGVIGSFFRGNLGNDKAFSKFGVKGFLVRVSPLTVGSKERAKEPKSDGSEAYISDKIFNTFDEAEKEAKKMSDSSLNRVAYVKFMTAADVAKCTPKEDMDYYGQLKNFGYGGFLYEGGKMTHDSSVRFEELLKKMKLSSSKSSSSSAEIEEKDKKAEAEKPAEPAAEKSEEQKPAEPAAEKQAEPEAKEPETSKPALSSESEKDIVEKIKAKYPKTGASLISMLKKAGVLTEEVESAEEDDDMSEEEFLEELGKELKNSRECKEAWNAHDNFANPGVIDESPELEGTDNAVKECKPYKLVAHCKEENIDCEMKKPALEKPLLEDIDNVFDLFEAKDMKDDELPVDPEAAKLEVHTMLNDLVADEIEAINGYDDAKAEIMDTPIEHKDNILDTIDHIKEEEQEHIDELIGATTEIPFEKEEEHHDFAAEEGELAEETHAKYAKPEGDKVAAYNNALKYAKKENKPFIYGYTQTGDGKFFALEQPIKVSSSPAEAEKEFIDQHKRCSTVYMAYPEKEFVDESLQEDTVIDDFPEPEDEPMSDKDIEEAMGIKEPEEK